MAFIHKMYQMWELHIISRLQRQQDNRWRAFIPWKYVGKLNYFQKFITLNYFVRKYTVRVISIDYDYKWNVRRCFPRKWNSHKSLMFHYRILNFLVPSLSDIKLARKKNKPRQKNRHLNVVNGRIYATSVACIMREVNTLSPLLKTKHVRS